MCLSFLSAPLELLLDTSVFPLKLKRNHPIPTVNKTTNKNIHKTTSFLSFSYINPSKTVKTPPAGPFLLRYTSKPLLGPIEAPQSFHRQASPEPGTASGGGIQKTVLLFTATQLPWFYMFLKSLKTCWFCLNQNSCTAKTVLFFSMKAQCFFWKESWLSNIV